MEDDDFGGGQTDAGVASNSSFRRLTTSGLLTDELLRRVTIHDQVRYVNMVSTVKMSAL